MYATVPLILYMHLSYVNMQAASFNYDLLYMVSRAISDEVRAKVGILLAKIPMYRLLVL